MKSAIRIPQDPPQENLWHLLHIQKQIEVVKDGVLLLEEAEWCLLSVVDTPRPIVKCFFSG